jgi:galactitol-specific phosphotransferase system IIC component
VSPKGERIAIVVLLAVWALGAAFLPLGGMIHFLLVAALIVFLVGRLGRES